MTKWILLTATGLLVVLTLLPLWKNPAWWVRALDFPRLQLCVLAFVLLLAQASLLSYSEPLQILVSVLAGGCLAYQAWWIKSNEVGQLESPGTDKTAELVTFIDRRDEIRRALLNYLNFVKNKSILLP